MFLYRTESLLLPAIDWFAAMAAMCRASYCHFASWCQSVCLPRAASDLKTCAPGKFEAFLCSSAPSQCVIDLFSFLEDFVAIPPLSAYVWFLVFLLQQILLLCSQRACVLAVFLLKDNYGNWAWSGHKLFSSSWVSYWFCSSALLCHWGLYSMVVGGKCVHRSDSGKLLFSSYLGNK